jgi:nucleoside-diphosphate-sugar epimerase
MIVLVTGATGFVGAAVVAALLRHGHRVVGFVRDRSKARALEEAGVTVEVGDMWEPATYQHLPARVDAVIHAAESKLPGRWSRRKIDEMHASDALMTRTLAASCLEQGKPFVYTSGALCYGGNDWLIEETPPRPCRLAQGHAEMVAELTRLHKERGLRALVITPGFVYGPGGMLKDFVEQLRRNQLRVVGTGRNYWSMVHVEDLAEVDALALERGRAGEQYFVGDDEPLTRRAFMDQLCDALGLKRVGHVAGWIVGLMLGFALVEAMNTSVRLRNDKAKRQLGWVPRYPKFAAGLPAVLAKLLPSKP